MNANIGERHLSLVNRAEALVPVEIGEPSLRFTQDIEESNSESISIRLNLLQEWRDNALIRTMEHKQRVERYFNRKVNLRTSKLGIMSYEK